MINNRKKALKNWPLATLANLLFLVLINTFLALPDASARDLHGRFGLGYNSEFSNFKSENGIPGISVKYGFTRDFTGEVITGIGTTTPTNYVYAVKFHKNIFYETNLNFYFFLGGGLVGASTKSGAEFLTGFGVEFFIPGIESVGLSMETGGSMNNLSGSFVFQTMGVSFLNAGMHFYF